MNTELDTEFFLPNKSTFNKEIESIMETKYERDSSFLSIFFHNFVFEDGMKKCDFEYYLDIDDVAYFKELLAKKFGVSNPNNIFILIKLFDTGDATCDHDDEFEILNNAWDDLNNTQSDIFEKLHDYCKNKAYAQFKVAFNYWVYDEDKEKYYEYTEI